MLIRQILRPDMAPEGITVLPKLVKGTLHIRRLEKDLTDLSHIGVHWWTKQWQLSILSLARWPKYIRTYIHTYLVAAEPSHHLELQQVVWEHVNHIQNELVALSVVSAGHNHQKAHQAPMHVRM